MPLHALQNKCCIKTEQDRVTKSIENADINVKWIHSEHRDI